MKQYWNESQLSVTKRFHLSLKMGRMWENYLMNALPETYSNYNVEHVQDILGFDTYRQNNNKYPDFRILLFSTENAHNFLIKYTICTEK